MSHGFGFLIESMVAVLLLLTILYCVRLSKQLRLLRADEQSLRATIAELRFILSRKAQVAREKVNSPVSSTLRRLSLVPALLNISIGGRSLTALKKL